VSVSKPWLDGCVGDLKGVTKVIHHLRKNRRCGYHDGWRVVFVLGLDEYRKTPAVAARDSLGTRGQVASSLISDAVPRCTWKKGNAINPW